ncbi:beta-galactosidase [Alkalibacterium pelagium]|uniref:Beta-galactosidase n=1 Tax=Alkalibacterium pelagium TaxID=426702 RepID=A0A1H7IEA5_9LACT|nr:beta-galactosidase [Alkalibacterium pelagium]GEN50057.1 beta-galactosidase LacZ [Alkalibacterium pelagium]SEK60851.1 beta-galactosidase [Alkalibacterium pelagium]
MAKQLFDKMLYGGDYNPEQWPREIWDEDMRLFKKAHINSATVNVFSWAKLQPSEQEYNFSELDDIINMLSKENYEIVLGTSTAAIPAWLCRKYPDIMRVDFEGRKQRVGHRHNHCPNSPTFHRFAKRLVSKVAERYGDNPHVKVWHISNEYGGECYCENCERAFRVWVKDKYKTIDAVNEAWNMHFWSHTLHSFDDIFVPNYLGDGISDTAAAYAGLSIDYRRFNSESLLNNFIMEREAIREFDKETPVTTNFMGAYKPLDYFKWAKEMDIASWDNYPGLHTTLSQTNMNNDLMRGVKDGQSFMLMEQTPSQQNWQPYNTLKRPGKMRAQSYQTIAHGADTIQFFQMRRTKGAVEKFHGAVIEHVGHEQTRVFREVTELGKELEQLGDTLIGAETKARVGILFDWDNYWALEYTSGPTVDLRYVDQIQRYYDACYNQQVAIDMIHMDSDFEKYDIVLAPVLYMVKEGIAEKIDAFVKQGGTFLTTYMSGIVDQSDNVHLGGYPGPLRETLGIWVEEIDALAPNSYNSIKTESDLFEKNDYTCMMICDLMHTEGAEVIAEYGSDFYKGMPVVTKNKRGEGEAWYVGAVLEQNMLNELIAQLLDQKGIKGFGPLPEGVEIASRVKDGKEFFFVMNHSDQTHTIETEFEGYTDLLSGEKAQRSIELQSFDVQILTP